jgi:C4-type Zn-finger protein
MGLILTAYCEKCGFKRDEIFFGAGKSNHKTVCDVPAIDRNTNQFVVENYLNKENIGDNIQFYTDQELFKG